MRETPDGEHDWYLRRAKHPRMSSRKKIKKGSKKLTKQRNCQHKPHKPTLSRPAASVGGRARSFLRRASSSPSKSDSTRDLDLLDKNRTPHGMTRVLLTSTTLLAALANVMVVRENSP